MARPRKAVVDYFPHDANASEVSDTLDILEGNFGHTGYAFWFKLLEKISLTENQVIDTRNSIKWLGWLARQHFSEGEANAMLDLLAKVDGIDNHLWTAHKIIWCQHLVDRVVDVYKTRKDASVPVKPVLETINSVSLPINSVSDIRNSQTKLKETKGNKKEYIKKENQPLKQKYGTELPNVLLSTEEHEKLVKRFGEQDTSALIDDLSLAKAGRGYKSKSDYYTILNWARRKAQGGGNGQHQAHSGQTPSPARGLSIPLRYTRPEELGAGTKDESSSGP